ncbi:MAG: DUF1254 domain-containing protein [Candidatus Acidiferrum sp.]
MRFKMLRLWTAGIIGIFVAVGCNNEGAKRALTPAEAKDISREAYTFGLPLVYIGLMFDVNTDVANPEGTRAPVNQFAHVREFPDAKANPIVGMNVDTLYSLASLDLSQEPIVLSIPEMGKRWWLMQLLDMWNDVPAAPGSRTVGGKGGNFALVGPNWTGSLPPGLTEIRCDTNLMMIGGRTYTAGKLDYANVHKVQDGYKLTPLSKWRTDYKSPRDVPVKAGFNDKTPIPKQVFAMSPDEYYSRLDEMLVGNPARPADAPVMARMAKLGIVPGKKFSMAGFDPEQQKAIGEGVAEAQKDIIAGQAKMGKMVNGWQVALDLGRYGTNYLYRASWTYFGVGGNLAEDAIYPLAITDSDGKVLSGTNSYTLTFPKGQLPPVGAFWSLTMYDADSFLVPNALNRYALGDRDKWKLNKDGSLTIYVQEQSPAKDKEANWLPAPKGDFKVALRLYMPKHSVIEGTWTPPPLERVK